MLNGIQPCPYIRAFNLFLFWVGLSDPKMAFPFIIGKTIINFFFLFSILIFFLFSLSNGDGAVNKTNEVTNIGAIIDVSSRIGKEEKIAMEIAAENFNNNHSKTHKLFIYFQDPGQDPLQVVSAG
jgi:hypothetical protein